MKTAWYLGHRADSVTDRAILIGDPDRVDRIADLLEDVRLLPVKRGLRTATGRFAGSPITVVSFGMGAPIATIVLHELADLGVRRFLRIGTAMYFPPARGGDFLVSHGALCFEGTSPSYATGDGPHAADPELVAAMVEAAGQAGETVSEGLFASYDAFYRDMFGIDPAGRERAAANRDRLAAEGVVAVDMETSALLAAAGALGVACTSLCLGTVNALTQEKLDADALAVRERRLFEIALAGMARDA